VTKKPYFHLELAPRLKSISWLKQKKR
jgi:hypothetical protein